MSEVSTATVKAPVGSRLLGQLQWLSSRVSWALTKVSPTGSTAVEGSGGVGVPWRCEMVCMGMVWGLRHGAWAGRGGPEGPHFLIPCSMRKHAHVQQHPAAVEQQVHVSCAPLTCQVAGKELGGASMGADALSHHRTGHGLNGHEAQAGHVTGGGQGLCHLITQLQGIWGCEVGGMGVGVRTYRVGVGCLGVAWLLVGDHLSILQWWLGRLGFECRRT